MYKKILVPLDGSIIADLAAEHAVDLAKLLAAEVTFLHVISVRANIDRSGEGYHGIYQDLLIKGQEIIKNAEEAYGSFGVSINGKLIWGNPLEGICMEAKEGRYDLIVMGSRGLSEIKGFLIGGVINKVVRYAPCPVLVVR